MQARAGYAVVTTEGPCTARAGRLECCETGEGPQPSFVSPGSNASPGTQGRRPAPGLKSEAAWRLPEVAKQMPKCGAGWNKVRCPTCVPRPRLRGSKRFPIPDRDPVSLGHKEACPHSDLKTCIAAEEGWGGGWWGVGCTSQGPSAGTSVPFCFSLSPLQDSWLFAITLFVFFSQRAS